jgi:hypothetical protein
MKSPDASVLAPGSFQKKTPQWCANSSSSCIRQCVDLGLGRASGAVRWHGQRQHTAGGGLANVSPRRGNVLPSRPLNTEGLLRDGSGGGVRVEPGVVPGATRGLTAPDSADGRRPGTVGREGVRGGTRVWMSAWHFTRTAVMLTGPPRAPPGGPRDAVSTSAMLM